jgi:apolipoprotein N-acyltransferase
LPLVRAANTGISAVTDPLGRIVRSLPLGAEGVLDAPLPRPTDATFASRYGERIALILVLAALVLCGIVRCTETRSMRKV